MDKRTGGAAILAIVTGLGAGGMALPAMAQGFGISGEIGFGASVEQRYFGSENYRVSPSGNFSLEALTIGPISTGTPGVERDTTGFGLRGALRVISERTADDDPELAGLEDVPFSVEAGLGVAYETERYRIYAEARYGVIGHNAWVGEIGSDVIYRPTQALTISAGPRLFFGSDAYANTYFGVTGAEADLSTFDAFDASGGILSAGLEVRVDQRLNDNWSVRGELEISEFLNDAAISPITQEPTHAILSVTLARRFSFGF